MQFEQPGRRGGCVWWEHRKSRNPYQHIEILIIGERCDQSCDERMAGDIRECLPLIADMFDLLQLDDCRVARKECLLAKSNHGSIYQRSSIPSAFRSIFSAYTLFLRCLSSFNLTNHTRANVPRQEDRHRQTLARLRKRRSEAYLYPVSSTV